MLGSLRVRRYGDAVTRRAFQWAFILGGLLVALWGVLSWVAPTATCRGEVMAPGDVCHYSSYTDEETSRTESYEQRVATARGSAPVVVVLGLAAAGFGAAVARGGVGSYASRDIGP